MNPLGGGIFLSGRFSLNTRVCMIGKCRATIIIPFHTRAVSEQLPHRASGPQVTAGL